MTRTNVAGAAVQPKVDVITQSDLRAVCEANSVTDRLSNNIARRMELGATVEHGRLVIEDVYNCDGHQPGAPVQTRCDLAGTFYAVVISERTSSRLKAAQ